MRGLTDERLCRLAQDGDRLAVDELLRRHEPAVRGIASDYFLPGGTSDDLRQEARVALLLAVRGFDGRSPFVPFARLVIRRRVVTAVKTATRVKDRGFNESVRVAIAESGDEQDATELLAAPNADPHARLEEREELARIARGLRQLSPLERAAVIGFANGLSYAEISAHTKGVDNALQRGREKLRVAA